MGEAFDLKVSTASRLSPFPSPSAGHKKASNMVQGPHIHSFFCCPRERSDAYSLYIGLHLRKSFWSIAYNYLGSASKYHVSSSVCEPSAQCRGRCCNRPRRGPRNCKSVHLTRWIQPVVCTSSQLGQQYL